jgi:hypothetical protein
VDVHHEVSDQSLDILEHIDLFAFAIVPMIALAELIVIKDHTLPGPAI